MKLPNLAEIKKAVAATGAGLTALVAAGVLAGVSLTVAHAAIAVVGAVSIGLGVYAAPANK